MISSELIDVVIGLVFAWFLLSLVVSGVNEALAWATRTRAKLLWRGVGQLLSAQVEAADARLRTLLVTMPRGVDDMRPAAETEASALSPMRGKADRTGTATDGADPAAEPDEASGGPTADLMVKFYEHVRRRVPDPAPRNWRTRISHIPTDVIGDAVESLAAETVTARSLVEAAGDDRELVAALGDLGEGALDRQAVSDRVPSELRERFDVAWDRARSIITYEDLAAVLAANPALVARVKAAVGSLTGSEAVLRARAEVERWFDATMDALTRFYRRQNRKIAALIALPVVFLANSDAFDLVDRLQDDQDLRAAAATSVADWAVDPLIRTESGAIDFEAACERVADLDDGDEAPAATGTPPTSSPDPIDESRRRYRCAAALFESSELLGPIGPGPLVDEIADANGRSCLVCDVASWSYEDLPGRIVTWIAVLFGSAFWYDVLRRVVGLKSKVTAA
jgi:hypothetical protein